MANSKTGRIQNQDDWKRTQVRMPQDQYLDIVSYAEENNLSLNTAMIELMAKGKKPISDEELAAKIAEKVAELLNKKES